MCNILDLLLIPLLLPFYLNKFKYLNYLFIPLVILKSEVGASAVLNFECSLSQGCSELAPNPGEPVSGTGLV